MLFVICDSADIPVYAVLEQIDKEEKFRVLNINLDIPVEEELTFQALIILMEQYNWTITKRYNSVEENTNE